MDEESVQPTAVRSIWRAIGFGLVMLVIWLSLTPRPIAIPVEHGDKLDHLAAYATLMFWFAQLDTRHRKRLAYAIGFVTLGVALEYAQRLTHYRTFEVADMGANTVGVLLGWIVSPPRGPDIISLSSACCRVFRDRWTRRRRASHPCARAASV